MKKFIFFTFLILLLFLNYAQDTYKLHILINQNDSLNLLNIYLSNDSASYFSNSKSDNYSIQIVSKDGLVLFNNSNNYVFSFAEFGSTMNVNQIEEFWNLPYFDSAKKIKFYHDKKLIWDYDVEYLSSKSANVSNTGTIQNISKSDLPSNNSILIFLFILCIIAIAVFLIWKKLKK